MFCVNLEFQYGINICCISGIWNGLMQRIFNCFAASDAVTIIDQVEIKL